MAKILIVDDDPIVLRVVRLALEREGHDVTACANGALALEQLESEFPDAMITDIEMPRMTGEELCKAIEERFPNRTFPIFVATSLTALEHRRWSSSIANLRFLEKPVSARRLISQLNDCLREPPSTMDGAHE